MPSAHDRPAMPDDRRLRRLHPVRRRPPRQRAGPGRRALQDQQRRGRFRRCSPTSASRAPTAASAPRSKLGARADGRRRGRPARHRPGRDPPPNFIQPEEFPYFIPTGNVYDCGNYEAVLDKALELPDYDRWRRKQAEARGRAATSASASPPARSAASSAPPSSGCWSRSRASRSRLARRGQRQDRPDRQRSSRSRRRSGATAPRRWRPGAGRGVQMDPADISVATPIRARPARHGPGRQPLHGDAGRRDGGRRGQDQAQDAARRRAHARGRRRRPRAGSTAVQVKGAPGRARRSPRSRSMPTSSALLPARTSERAGRDRGLRPSVHDDAGGRPQGPRRLLPDHGPPCHMPVIEVDPRPAGQVPRLRRGARLRHAGEPADARRPHSGGTAQGIGTALYEEFLYDEDGQL